MISTMTLSGLYSEARCSAFAAVHGYAPDEASPWSEWAVVPLDFGDRLWAVWSLVGQRSPDRCAVVLTALREIALLAADAALPIWESKHPATGLPRNDHRPRLALEVARDYLANPTEGTVDRALKRARLDRAINAIHRSGPYFAYTAAASVHYDTPYYARHAVNSAATFGDDLTLPYERPDLTLAHARFEQLVSDLESP